MKKHILLFITVATVLFFTGCNGCSKSGHREPKTNVDSSRTTVVQQPIVDSPVIIKNSPEFLSHVDTSAIKTFDDYSVTKARLFDEYSVVKSKAWDDYLKTKAVAWDDYSSKTKSALMNIRQNHNAKYLEWLDAEQMNDYNKKLAIERSPEFVEYIAIDQTEYQKYKEVAKSSYSEYQRIEQESYKEYQLKEGIADKAYQQK